MRLRTGIQFAVLPGLGLSAFATPAVSQVELPGIHVEGATLAGKSALGDKSTAFACLGTQCSLPVTEAEALLALLRRQRAIDTARLSTAN